MQFLRYANRRGINRAGEHPANQHQQHLVRPQAAQFLNAETEDVGQGCFHINLIFLLTSLA